jgi:hypothetical protein
MISLCLCAALLIVKYQPSTKHANKTKDRVTGSPLKTGGEPRCSGRVSSPCSTSGIRRVNLVTSPVICHEWGNDQEVITPSGTYYCIYLSQVIRYSRVCGSYQEILDRGLLLTRKLLNHGFLLIKLKSSLRTFYGRHLDLIDRYGISVSQMTTDMFHLA